MKYKKTIFAIFILFSGFAYIWYLRNAEPGKRKSIADSIPSVDYDSSEQIKSKQIKSKQTFKATSDIINQIKMAVLIDKTGYMKITIHNDTECELTTGEDYIIQRLVNDTWEEILQSMAWVDLGLLIPAKESRVFEYNISSLIDLSEEARYRISKSVDIDGTKIELSAEISIV